MSTIAKTEHERLRARLETLGSGRSTAKSSTNWATDWPVCLPHATYPQTLRVVRDEMKFLNDDDKAWMLSKTIERVWKFS